MTISEYLKNIRENVKHKSLQSVSDSSKFLYPDDKERQISASYLNRVEDGIVTDVSPRKLQTLAQIYEENYYYLLFLAGYIDENPQEIPLSNEMLLQKSIDFEKLLNDPTIKVHFSGSALDDDKKRAMVEILKILIKNTK
jgi:hypothetical protein